MDRSDRPTLRTSRPPCSLCQRSDGHDVEVPKLFVYGTLQHPPVIGALLGRVPEATAAMIDGYRAAPLRGRVFPGLVVDPASKAVGHVIEVSDSEVDVLDRFEGEQYERVAVRATPTDGRGADANAGPTTIEAGAWLLTGSSASLAESGVWSLKQFVLDGADSFVRGSTAGSAHPGAGPA